MRRIWSIFLLLPSLLLGVQIEGPTIAKTGAITYYGYSDDDLNRLEDLSSNHSLTPLDLKKWDQIAMNQFKGHDDHGLMMRLFAYLYTAQRDAGFLTYFLKKEFSCTLDPLSYGIMQLFFPRMKAPPDMQSDPFSDELARIVVEKFQERFLLEQAQIHQYNALFDIGYWSGNLPFFGSDIRGWIPWMIQPVDFEKTNLPLADWSAERQQIQQKQAELTTEQKEAAHFWSKWSGPTAYDWRRIANQFMFDHKVALGKTLLVRSVLMMTLVDVTITVYRSKSNVWVPPPFRANPNIISLIQRPTSESSYPALYSAIAAASVTTLVHFFPEEKERFESLGNAAQEAELHTGHAHPADQEAGKETGENVTRAILDKSQSNPEDL